MSDTDLDAPFGLTQDGEQAREVVMKFLTARGLTNAGGCRTFYSPKAWKERGEEYGLNSELVVVHDGGDVAAVCNLDYENYGLHDALQADLNAAGFYMEGCTCWYSAIYKE